MTVAIEIDKRTTRSPTIPRFQQTRLSGDVRKCPVAIIAIQDILSPVRNEEIVPAIVVVVANADCGRPSQALQACFFCDVSKRAVAIVSIKSVPGSARLPHPSSTKNENVRPAVLVVVEKCASAADRF